MLGCVREIECSGMSESCRIPEHSCTPQDPSGASEAPSEQGTGEGWLSHTCPSSQILLFVSILGTKANLNNKSNQIPSVSDF